MDSKIEIARLVRALRGLATKGNGRPLRNAELGVIRGMSVQ
jgi:hypothetical protein